MPRDITPVLPPPEHLANWWLVATMARDFWQRVADDGAISGEFRIIADGQQTKLVAALGRFG